MPAVWRPTRTARRWFSCDRNLAGPCPLPHRLHAKGSLKGNPLYWHRASPFRHFQFPAGKLGFLTALTNFEIENELWRGYRRQCVVPVSLHYPAALVLMAEDAGIRQTRCQHDVRLNRGAQERRVCLESPETGGSGACWASVVRGSISALPYLSA
ncbi:hypothetical protein MHYP_G00066510 [Metynnis hypsauchen]